VDFRCASTGKTIPEDKVIKRFIVRNIVDSSSLRDLNDVSVYAEYQLPKLYLKMYYCVEAISVSSGVAPRPRDTTVLHMRESLFEETKQTTL